MNGAPSPTPDAALTEDERCPVSWCAYPMPHSHSTGSPTFDALLADPTQQLDPEGMVIASMRKFPKARLTTAQKEWLDASMMRGFDALVDTVERILAARMADVWAEAIEASYDYGWLHSAARIEMEERNPYRRGGTDE